MWLDIHTLCFSILGGLHMIYACCSVNLNHFSHFWIASESFFVFFSTLWPHGLTVMQLRILNMKFTLDYKPLNYRKYFSLHFWACVLALGSDRIVHKVSIDPTFTVFHTVMMQNPKLSLKLHKKPKLTLKLKEIMFSITPNPNQCVIRVLTGMFRM